MIIYVNGPRLVPGDYYRDVEEEILTFFESTVRMAPQFARKDVRIFFPMHNRKPKTVEFAVFAGAGTSTLMGDVSAWQDGLKAIGEKYWPKCIFNGFVAMLSVNAQFGSVRPKVDPKPSKKSTLFERSPR